MSKGIDYSRFDHIDCTDSEEEEEEIEEPSSSRLVTAATTQRAVKGEELYRKSSDNHNSVYKEKILKNGWIQVGHVIIHPSERKTYFDKYPKIILTKDPKTFVPNPAKFKDGVVTDWGIEEPDTTQCQMQKMMERMQNIEMERRYKLEGYDDITKYDPTKQFLRILKEQKYYYKETDTVQTKIHWTYRLRVELCKCEKFVWRKITVPAGIDLSKLHDQVLIPVMGWSRGYHGHVFEDPKDGAVFGPTGKYDGLIDMMHASMRYSDIMDDRRYPLAAVLQQIGDCIYYTYDLGDCWRHRIELIGIDKDDNHQNPTTTSTSASNIRLIEGAGACPPEDGRTGLENGSGSYHYIDFLQEYITNPKSRQMKETIQKVQRNAQNYCKPWMGGPPLKFRPLEFDIQRHQSYLATVVAGPAILKEGPCGDGGYKECYKACSACGDRMKDLLVCAKCRSQWYCSRNCQVGDWKNHKPVCRERRRREEEKMKQANNSKT